MLKAITAVSKIIYDKFYDYGSYYINYEIDMDNEDESSDTEDKEYFDILNLPYDYGMTRLYPEPSYYELYSAFFSEPTHIIDNIWLGSSYNAASYGALVDRDIKLIINVSKEITHYFPNDFTYIRYDIYDNNKQSITDYLEKSYNDIIYHQHNKNGNIFVHCYMGRSRSVSILLYYIMKSKKHDNGSNYTFRDALNYIKSKRPIINPTVKFTRDLIKNIEYKNQTDNSNKV